MERPIADFYKHDAEQSDWLTSRPKCCDCEEPVQDDFYFEVGGEVYCEDCLNANFRRVV